MTNERINETVEQIMEYEALLDEVKEIVDGLKDILKTEMSQNNVETLTSDRFTVRWVEVLTSKLNTKALKTDHEDLYKEYLRQSYSRRFSISA